MIAAEIAPEELSEAAFKALHQHRGDEPPPLRGHDVVFDGFRGYLSLPEGEVAGRPAVVVLQEWWGLNDNIKHWADRLALDGYIALAPDLYEGKVARDPDEAMGLMKAVEPARALQIVRAAHAFLRSDPRALAQRTAFLGWCFGGHWALTAAIHEVEATAAVMYYGVPIMDVEQLRKLRGPLLGIFGDRDQSIPPDRVAAFREALQQAGVGATLLGYDADHAFANPSSARYDEERAAEAWREVRVFLARHLKP